MWVMPLSAFYTVSNVDTELARKLSSKQLHILLLQPSVAFAAAGLEVSLCIFMYI